MAWHRGAAGCECGRGRYWCESVGGGATGVRVWGEEALLGESVGGGVLLV